ncbi:MAG: prepilin peptidase [Gammaproteobacteria bacterium]|nr:prepilin peptidase [Gammaproteobacteria bacterium]
MLGWLLTVLLGLCLYFDIRYRQLPNWLNLLILVTGLFSLLTPVLSVDLIIDRLLAIIIISSIGAIIYRFSWLGGGDIKLVIALSPWLGYDKLINFFVLMTLAGGLLAILLLSYNQIANTLHVKKISTLPYGIAIVAGAMVLLI